MICFSPTTYEMEALVNYAYNLGMKTATPNI